MSDKVPCKSVDFSLNNKVYPLSLSTDPGVAGPQNPRLALPYIRDMRLVDELIERQLKIDLLFKKTEKIEGCQKRKKGYGAGKTLLSADEHVLMAKADVNSDNCMVTH